MIKDKSSVFVSNVIHETAEVPGVTLPHATTKHAQTVAVFGRTQDTLNTTLKTCGRQFCKQWHKYLPLAISNNNTTFHTNIGCKTR